MDQIPRPENQQFTEKTLKGFLLKNVDYQSTDPHIKNLNALLIKRVDQFWEDAVIPLRAAKKFDGNKIQWYYSIYKEGAEVRKAMEHPFTFVALSHEQIIEIVKTYEGKTIQEYLEFGTSFLSSTLAILTLWQRDQLMRFRLEHIYSSGEPRDWILRAEAEEKGIMNKKIDTIPGLQELINNISLIIARKV